MQPILRNLQRRASLFIGPSLAACILSYFSYHLIQGDRGILAWQKLEKQLASRQTDLKALQTNHHQLERRVKLLRQQICPDLLDEQAKQVLGYVHPDEVIIRHADIMDPSAPSCAK